MSFDADSSIVIPDDRPFWRRLLGSRGLQMLLLTFVVAWVAWRWAETVGGPEAIRERFGLWAAAVTVPLQAVLAVSPFPDEVIGFGNAAIYGFSIGFVLNWTGWMLGAFLEYSIAHRSARDLGFRYEHAAAKLPRPLRRLAPAHPAYLILVRLLPIGGGHIVNSSSGVFGVPLGRFAWTSAIGTIPGSLAIAALASGFLR
jgi:uncharacterized membrane protein YdjX (TVP38/TMEM64 family)